jgi:cell fate regulator YaaT (PSP1 superfamily)
MKDKKKRFFPHKENDQNNADRHDGQRISVRPGNFNPPPQKNGGAPVNPAPAAPAQNERKEQPNAQQGQKQQGQGHGKKNHHNRHRHNRPSKPEVEQHNGAPQAEKPQNGVKNNRNERHQQNENARHDGRDQRRDQGRDQRRDQSRDQRRDGQKQGGHTQKQNAAAEPLNDTFSTTLLTDVFGGLQKSKKEEAAAVDSDEFAVDIATAAYLVEDVPCGFPIPDGKAVEVVGVRFRQAGKVYFFAPDKESFRIGDQVLVDTARGPEFGEIVMPKRKIAEKNVVQPLRPVLRRATAEDKAHEQENRKKEAEALRICAEKIAFHKLDMKLVDAQFTFDNSKLLFYFTSDGRVDFRELVRDLAGIFHTRIELRQIGIRDESRLIGGLGMCGRPFCCSTYLSDFGQVSIKMAKEQGLSINTSKISGCCGRLMCCLRYEHETYAAEAALTPKKDALVSTPDGNGVVVDSTPLAGTVKVKLDNAPEEAPKTYHRDTVTVLGRDKKVAADDKKTDNGSENSANSDAATANGQAEN